jgi:hypothetical protein
MPTAWGELKMVNAPICKSVSGKSQITLDINSVPPGIYFLRITDNDGVTTRKIFKR